MIFIGFFIVTALFLFSGGLHPRTWKNSWFFGTRRRFYSSCWESRLTFFTAIGKRFQSACGRSSRQHIRRTTKRSRRADIFSGSRSSRWGLASGRFGGLVSVPVCIAIGVFWSVQGFIFMLCDLDPEWIPAGFLVTMLTSLYGFFVAACMLVIQLPHGLTESPPPDEPSSDELESAK